MKNKKQHSVRAVRLIDGLRISWADDADLYDAAEIRDQVISHRKPLLRTQAVTIWKDYYDWIMNHKTLLWRVDIDVIFSGDDGDVIDSRRLVVRGRLLDTAYACQPVIAQVLDHPDNESLVAKETRYRVECLGSRAKTDADYEDYEA